MARGRKSNPVAPGGVAQVPDCPEWLDEVARFEWARVVGHLGAAGVVQQTDLALLATYCCTWSMWRKLHDRVTQLDLSGERKPAAYTMWLETSKQLRGLLDQLGFSPAARKQILMGQMKTETLEDLLK